MLLVLTMRAAKITIALLLAASLCYSQTEAWPQISRRLDYEVWYSPDRPLTQSMILVRDGVEEPFYMLEHEVANKQWLEFLDYTGHPPPVCDFDREGVYAYHQRFAWRGRTYPPGQAGLPVVFISKWDAKEFCRWRSQQTGFVHRLPTEEEWDAAAGNTRYPWGDEVDELKVVPVGRHTESGPELFYAFTHDRTESGVTFLLGNVAEITSSMENGLTVLRGGAYDSNERRVSLQTRQLAVPGFQSYNIGFRYVIPVDEDGNPVRHTPEDDEKADGEE